MDRQQALNRIRQNPHIPVLIIGAGINGIGTFRDLALQGVPALLVDRGDFCSGASSASSHMVHGGIRYLENGELRLVREAVHERNRLIENAPHYVRPLPTVIPIFKWFSGLFNAPLKFIGLLDKPAERGLVVIKTGLMLYDAFTRNQGTVPRHQISSRDESLERYPQINPQVIFTACYYDGSMKSPERICIDLLLDAEAANPQAQAVNYLAVQGSMGDTITLIDQLSGNSYNVQPQLVINAAGPWIDLTNRNLGRDSHFIGGTKGSHLILDHPQLRTAIGENEFFFENQDGRLVLLFPLEDKVIVGTSDLPIDDPDSARCTEAEVDYFLKMITIVFPKIKVDRSDIIYRFSGVRPLPASQAATAGQISRDHSIQVLQPQSGSDFPIFNLIGGKWTSFRAFSEQATDQALRFLNLQRRVSTRDLPIGGGRDYPLTQDARQAWITSQTARTGLSPAHLQALLDRYGTRAAKVADFITSGMDQPLTHVPDYSQREVAFSAVHEKVLHLDDYLLRRTNLAKLGGLNQAGIAGLASILGDTLGWSDEQLHQEIQRTADILFDRHGIDLSAA